jgi:hypothetical protein
MSLQQLDAHAWLADRLKQHGAAVFDGDTTPAERVSRLRKAILESGLASVIAGKRAGKPETYAACFERITGEPLQREGA